jgi:transposase
MLRKAKERGDHGTMVRIMAVMMVASGASIRETASSVNVSDETVRIWLRKLLLNGPSSLDGKKRPGRQPKLSKKQRHELAKLIDMGPDANGYSQGGWNSAMIQQLIQDRFGVLYAVNYISQLLKNMGFSWQKAKFVSDHHSKKSRREWMQKKWPAILNLAERKNAYVLFGDEASFPQWGSLSYTWSRRGQQPEVKTAGVRRGYKVFGLIEYFTGKFFCKAQEKKLDSQTYIEFLEMVLKQTRKHLILIQDGARYHVSEDLMVFFYENRQRLTVFQLPTYSPDYNPIEMLWRNIKRAGIHLRYFPTFEDLKAKVNELLVGFENAGREILDLFGLYEELTA